MLKIQWFDSTYFLNLYNYDLNEFTFSSLCNFLPCNISKVTGKRVDMLVSLPYGHIFFLFFFFITQGSWIVRQSVGSTPCLLGKAVDCNYIRGPKYLEVKLQLFFISIQILGYLHVCADVNIIFRIDQLKPVLFL